MTFAAPVEIICSKTSRDSNGHTDFLLHFKLYFFSSLRKFYDCVFITIDCFGRIMAPKQNCLRRARVRLKSMQAKPLTTAGILAPGPSAALTPVTVLKRCLL